jgi:hypothetical protein
MLLARLPDFMAESEADLVHRMREAAPFGSDDQAKAALWSTLELVASGLTTSERDALARALPPSFTAAVGRAAMLTPSTDGGRLERIAERGGAAAGRAVEAAEVACSVIGQSVPASVRAWLAAALPDLARFFEPRAAPEPPPVHVGHPPSVPHDLAEGRPGSRHPLADANPLERAHRHSVARSDDPHGDSKLSSARGLSQERAGQTLATGEPGSSRPLSRDH